MIRDCLARRMHKCAEALIANDNSSRTLTEAGLDRIADYQKFDRAEWRAVFANEETKASMTPCEQGEGK